MIKSHPFAFTLLLSALSIPMLAQNCNQCHNTQGGGSGGTPLMREFSVTNPRGQLTIHNGSVHHTIVAFHLEHPDGRVINQVVPIAPGKERAFLIDGSGFVVEGLMWDDGHVSGPNKWGVDLHFKLWQQIQAGGPAYASPAAPEDAGDSFFYANVWAKHFNQKHGFKPQVITEARPNCYHPNNNPDLCLPPPPPPSMYPNTWTSIGTYDNSIVFQATGPTAHCDVLILVPGPLYDTVVCSGIAACILPNAQNKGSLSVGIYATSACPQSVIGVSAELTTTLGQYTGASADGFIDYVDGTQVSCYQTDSCTGKQVSGPPTVTNCSNAN